MTESARFRRMMIDAMVHDSFESAMTDDTTAVRVLAECARVMRPYRHDRRDKPRAGELPPVDARRKSGVLEMIMIYGHPTEPLALSVSRLSTAAWYIGFKRLTAFSTWATYRTFPQLREEWTAWARQR